MYLCDVFAHFSKNIKMEMNKDGYLWVWVSE